MIASSASKCLLPSSRSVPQKSGFGNTRLNSPTPLPAPSFDTGIDWITCSVPIQSYTDVLEVISLIQNITIDDFSLFPGRSRCFTGNTFLNSGYSVNGASIYWNLPESLDKSGKLLISLNGKALAPCNLMEKYSLIYELHCMNATFSRIDIFLDIFNSSDICFDNLYEAYKLRNYAGCSKRGFYQSGDEIIGSTFTFGSRESDIYHRIYDKGAQMKKYDVPWWRMEQERKARQAQAIVNALIECEYNEEKIRQLLINSITGHISFVDRKGVSKETGREKNIERCKPLSWWSSFLQFISSTPVRFSLPAPQKTLDKSVSWIDKQVVTTVAMIHETFGEREFQRMMREWLKNGRSRFTESHNSIIRLGRKLRSSLSLLPQPPQVPQAQLVGA